MRSGWKSTIEEARSLARDLKYGDAERKYLEVLGLDKRNVEAYKGLAALYLKQKMLPQAKETFEFLLRTTGKLMMLATPGWRK